MRRHFTSANKRHCPLFANSPSPVPGTPAAYRCIMCGRDALDPIHWPPRGLKETILATLGVLR